MQSGRGFEYGVHHLISHKAAKISEILFEKLMLSESTTNELLTFGAVYLNHLRITTNDRINDQDLLRVHTKPRRFLRKVDWTKSVVKENLDYLVLDKPAGLPCHSTVDNLNENLVTQASIALNLPLYLTHRLDVPTSGLLVLAKNLQAQSRFNRALVNSEVHKIYHATVCSPGPQVGTYEHYMQISPRAPKQVQTNPGPNTQNCILEILEREITQDHCKLKIRLLTGRTHQIRAQLAHLGFPINGDIQYGAKEKINLEWDEISLRSIKIEWPEFQASMHF